MKNKLLLMLTMGLCSFSEIVTAQDTAEYQLRLSVPVYDYTQNKDLPHRYPSMNQALEFSNDLYELSYLGIDKLGSVIFHPKRAAHPTRRKFVSDIFKYALGLSFSKYGSELPIPLGVWAHEEFHRSVLGVEGINSKNGNWFPHRWDGSVYGISDSDLTKLKDRNPDQLIYSYVAGVQSETMLNQRISIQDFYQKRTLPKNALLLYNAWYVYDYFRFATGPMSDSVKVLAPAHESSDPRQRDYAGADLNAWALDMFHPKRPFTERDRFPDGEGVNRRIGFSDLSPEEQKFMQKQKKLSLLNFANPAIFFINRINLGKNTSFNFFAQYAPTHFGNNAALFVPVQFKKTDLLVGVHKYSSYSSAGLGLDFGSYNHKVSDHFETDFVLHFWNQPKTFFGDEKNVGGALEFQGRYAVGGGFSIFATVFGKTEGWIMGSPYLKSNVSGRIGINFNLKSSAR